jgi:FtsZ-binding cell division protein ZapB
MLNWRRDPGYEQRINAKLIEIEQIKKEIEQIKSDSAQIKSDSAQIKKETEQLRRENARLRSLNAKTKTLLSYVDQHCFAPESNSTPIPPIEPGSSSC